MAEVVRSSVSIEYKAGETEDLGPPAIVLERDNVKPPYGTGYARMYFVGKTPNVISTSGYTVNTLNRNVVSDELEFIIFQGRDEASFPTPVVSNVTLTPLGRLIGLAGESLSQVGFTVDTARGTLKANKPFYGTIQAEYNSTFHRLSTEFRKIPGAKDDTRYDSEFAPLVLIATQVGNGESVSLSLNPPTKDEDPDRKDKKGGFGGDDKSTGEKIVLELDDTFPISLTHSTQQIPGLAAVARVAVYSPHAGVSFSVSRGFVKTNQYALDEVLELKETVNFVGSQSASVKYPPANGITVEQVGEVTSKAMGGGIFQFATAPSIVSLAEWFSYGAYQITGSRPVGSNEIVATSVGVAVPVSGQVRATYNTRRTFIDVFWERDGTWFPPVVLTATDAWGNTESITISAPERRGR